MATHHTPQLGPRLFKTYSIRTPIATHTRPASCAEVECPAWRDGYQVTVDEGTELGARQAGYLRRSGVSELLAAPGARQTGARRYRELRQGSLTVFQYPAGTQCMGAEHRVRIERPELYIVRGGDWRTPAAPARRHTSAEHWLEDFGGHQDRLADRHKRG